MSKESGTPEVFPPGDILVVDDTLASLRSIEVQLRERGYKVRCVTDGKTAIAVATHQPPELMLLDVVMPGMSGYNVCRALKSLPDTVDFPIIFLTSLTETEDIVEGFGAGGVDFLSKPVRPDEMVARVKTHIELYQARKAIQEHKDLLEQSVADRTFELQQANLKLTESEEIHRTLYRNASVGLFRVTLDDGRALAGNRVAAELFGYSSVHEFLDEFRSMNHYVNIEDREPVVSRLKEDGHIDKVEVYSKKKDGTRMWIENSHRMVRDKGYAECVAVDVTERRNAEEELSSSLTTIQALLNAPTDDSILLIDPQGTIIEANDSAAEGFGRKRLELLGMDIFALMPPQVAEMRKRYLRQVVETKMPVHFEDTRGGIVFQNHVYPVNDGDGQLTRLAVFARDITEVRELERHLRQIQKMEAIGTLAGGIAHDFNNILSAIFGFTDIAKNHLHEPDRLREDLSEVSLAAERAKDLVRQILTFSRKADREIEPLNMRLVVKEAMKLLRATIPATVKIKQGVVASSRVLADPTYIHQVVMNLCTNAYHAMRETGGVLCVFLEDVDLSDADLYPGRPLPPGPYVRLRISDTGHGIEGEVLQRMFEPYFTTKEPGDGTGLGLAVVHGIVSDLGGYIYADSTPAVGTTFEVFFPVDNAEVGALPEEQDITPAIGGQERIMVVDDDAKILQIIGQALSRHGYAVTAFSHGVEALEAFEKRADAWDVVITDMGMPSMTGTHLAQRMMEIRPGMPVILCTGHSDSVDRKMALAMGIEEFLEKPLSMNELAETIRDVLDRDTT
jgi:PAS domain S-box-containing protein